MTGYINKFKNKKTKITTTMSLMIKDKIFLKITINMGKN